MFEWSLTNVLNLQVQMELAFNQRTAGVASLLGCWKSTQGKVSASFSQGSLPTYCEQTGLYDHRSLACVVLSPQQGLYIQHEWPPIYLQPGCSAVTCSSAKKWHAHDSHAWHLTWQPLTLPPQPCLSSMWKTCFSGWNCVLADTCASQAMFAWKQLAGVGCVVQFAAHTGE